MRRAIQQLYSRHVQNVLPIKGIHELQVVRLVRQIMNDEVFHHTNFAFRDSIQSLRDVLRIGAPNVRTALGSRQMSYSGPMHFNMLPFEIRRISDTSKFIRSVKQYLASPLSIERLFSSWFIFCSTLLSFCRLALLFTYFHPSCMLFHMWYKWCCWGVSELASGSTCHTCSFRSFCVLEWIRPNQRGLLLWQYACIFCVWCCQELLS